MTLQWVTFCVVLLGIAAYYWRQSRNLVSPQKELLSAKLSFLALFALFFVGQFGVPGFSYYVDTSPIQIETFDDARLAIQRSNELHAKMADDLKEWARMNWMFSFVLVALTLSSFLCATEALASQAKEQRDDPDKLISTLKDDK